MLAPHAHTCRDLPRYLWQLKKFSALVGIKNFVSGSHSCTLAPHAYTCRDLPRFILFVYLTGLSPGQQNLPNFMSYNLPGSPRVVPHFIVHVVQPAGLPPGCATFTFKIHVVQPAGLPPGCATFTFKIHVVQPAGLPPGCATLTF